MPSKAPSKPLEAYDEPPPTAPRLPALEATPPATADRAPPGMVDLRPCKREFERLLPPWHPNRIAILREPDFLPLAEAVAKAETYLRIAASWQDW